MKRNIQRLAASISSIVLVCGLVGCAGSLNGKSAYELAVKNGYKGTEAEWLNSLIGASGKDGIDGEKGEKATRVTRVPKAKKAPPVPRVKRATRAIPVPPAPKASLPT
jgi:hypothetical protein